MPKGSIKKRLRTRVAGDSGRYGRYVSMKIRPRRYMRNGRVYVLTFMKLDDRLVVAEIATVRTNEDDYLKKGRHLHRIGTYNYEEMTWDEILSHVRVKLRELGYHKVKSS